MDEEDVYYVDSRNAVPRQVTLQQGVRRPPMGTRTIYVPHATRPSQFAPSYGAAQYAPGYPTPYAGAPVVYGTPASPFGSLFGSLTTGQLIDIVAQLFAMFQPLPAAPSPTADGTTDIGNSILYQQALASYAKRDEQVRTLGSIVSKLVG